jgi:hypothetical protein
VIFRLTGYQRYDAQTSELGEMRYVVLFKLTRYPYNQPDQPGENWNNAAGNYQIADSGWYPREHAPRRFGQRGCMAIIVYGPGPTVDPEVGEQPTLGRLNKIPLGGRVKITLRPISPLGDGKWTLGKTYVSRARLRRSDVRLRDLEARRALKRLGCQGGRRLP